MKIGKYLIRLEFNFRICKSKGYFTMHTGIGLMASTNNGRFNGYLTLPFITIWLQEMK